MRLKRLTLMLFIFILIFTYINTAFVFALAIPSAPSIDSPYGTTTDLTPRFKWSKVQGADKYAIYISVSPYGADNIVYQNVNISGSKNYLDIPSGYIKQEKSYRWNMRAHNSAGWSELSAKKVFEVGSSTTKPTSTPTPSKTSIQLLSPNGGEKWKQRESKTISWTVNNSSSRISYFWIDYSTDGGSSFFNLSSAMSDYRSIIWKIPSSILSSKVRIRVRALNSSGKVLAADISNSNFTISVPPKKKVSTPIASLASGTYTNFNNVTLSCTTAGATIRYTTNGSNPTSSSKKYSGAIKISSTTTLKAKAFKPGMTESGTAAYVYTIGTRGSSFDTAIEIAPGLPYGNSISTVGSYKYFKFTATNTGSYKIGSTGSLDTFGYLYNENKEWIASNNDSVDKNFEINSNLTAGQTYYIVTKLHSLGETGSFSIMVTPLDIAPVLDLKENSYVVIDSGEVTVLGTITSNSPLTSVSITSADTGKEEIRIQKSFSGDGKTFDLSDIPALSTNESPLNTPGTYNFNIFATSQGYTNSETPIGSFTVIVTDNENDDFAATLAYFPISYHDGLISLHTLHPNWRFEAYNTGIDFNSFIDREMSDGKVCTPEVNYGYSPVWRDPKYAYTKSDGTISSGYDDGYYAASKEAVSYFIDPRNFMDDTQIFQFLSAKYDSATQNIEEIDTILNGTALAPFAEYFLNAGGTEMSSAFLAAKSRIETGGGTSDLARGEVEGYEGFYNFFGIGAYDGNANQGGGSYAKEHGWNSPELSINGGEEYIYTKYVLKGQDTLYTMKWNIDAYLATGKISGQYATHIKDAFNKAKLFAQSIKGIDAGFTFRIPVYDNMPEPASPKPTQAVVRVG